MVLYEIIRFESTRNCWKSYYVSRINGRSANMQILIYVQKTVERYESDNGPIEVRGIKYTPSKKLPDEKR